MGQRKNKLTKKERKALRKQSNLFFNDYDLFDDSFDFDTFLDNDPNSITIGDSDPHSGSTHYTDFVCSHCGIHEDIPTHIVMEFEFRDHEQPNYMPAFKCEKCGYDMYPVYFKGFTGKVYEYKF